MLPGLRAAPQCINGRVGVVVAGAGPWRSAGR